MTHIYQQDNTISYRSHKYDAPVASVAFAVAVEHQAAVRAVCAAAPAVAAAAVAADAAAAPAGPSAVAPIPAERSRRQQLTRL